MCVGGGGADSYFLVLFMRASKQQVWHENIRLLLKESGQLRSTPCFVGCCLIIKKIKTNPQ